MATLREIKRRISSVKSTQQITRAMKMVAAAKLRKSQQWLTQSRPYAEELFRLASFLSQRRMVGSHPYFEQRPVKNVCYVLITADRGLCGSFNSNLIRTANQELEKYVPLKPCLMTVGRKGYDHYKRREYPVAGYYVDFFNSLSLNNAEEIVNRLVKRFEEKAIDQIFVVYNEFQSIVQQRILVKPFLPIVPLPAPEKDFDMLYEPHPRVILDDLLPNALKYQMYQMLLESYTAEQGARMTAMEQASDNADAMIKDLVLFYNKTRQAAITTELSEIVSGAEALRG